MVNDAGGMRFMSLAIQAAVATKMAVDESDPENIDIDRNHVPESDLEKARQDIRGAGFRATPARIATLLELRAAKTPMTHAELAERLAAGGFDKATAFRNLNDLTNGGLLRRTELGDHVWRFEAIDENDHHKQGHPHFVCVDCGSVTCMDDVQLTPGSRKQSDTVGEITEILLRGHCKDCK